MPHPPLGPSVPPPGYGPPHRAPKRGPLVAAGVVTAVLLATAALVVSLVGMNRPVPSASTTTTSTAEAPPTTAAPSSDTAAADRKLCEDVGPLLRESNETGKAFVNLGVTGTPARDAGIPDYEASVLDWVKRIQPVLDRHPSADPYLRRMLQRMVDDIHSYATSIRPGPATDPDAAAWNDASVAYGGPFDVCHRLGVRW